MQVQKRNGSLEQVKFDKVTTRIEKLSDGLDVSPVHLAQKVLASITDGIKTSEIDDITADIAVSMPTGDYPTLAARIIVSNLHKTCPNTFTEAMYLFYNDNPPYISALQRVVVYPERDNLFDFFGLKTLMRMYLKKDIETPQYMFMRVALAICDGDPVSAQETYDAMSLKYYTHATPTLFNAGTSRPQCSSCFVAGTMVDTVNRGPVPIEEIDIGDVVTTHIGNQKPVDQVHRNLLAGRQLYTLQVGSHMPVTATEDHRFWTINGLKDPEWVRMDRLKMGDYIKTLGGTFQRVNSVEPVFVTPKYVYTLGVADDHSYTVYGVVAENCYLLSMKGDSIEGIYDTKKECALISRMAGGIGLHIHNIRAKGSKIYGTDGVSDGIIPMLRTINADARYVNQCFTPETTIYTNTGPKRIDSIVVGDEVTTIDGSHKKVREIFRNHVAKNIFNIRVTHSVEPTRVTGEHDIYAITNQAVMLNYNVIRNRLEKNIIRPKFVAANTLKVGDFVGFPIPTKVVDFDETPDFFRFYGIMIGDGHMVRNRNEFGVSLGVSKADTIIFMEHFLASRGIRTWKNFEYNTYSIRWTGNVDKVPLTREMLYIGTTKNIDPRFLHLPMVKTYALIKGLMETDGGITHEVQFHTTSKNVAYSLRYMLTRVGVLSSGHIKKADTRIREMSNGKTIQGRLDMYVLRIPKHEALRPVFGDTITYSTTVKYFVHNHIMWSRIKTMTTEYYDGYVYDLSIEDNHNYTTDMGLVHNSGRRKGSYAIYLEPWHADVMDFLELRLNQGDEEARCRDLFTAMWIPDLFMKRLEANQDWSLFCPNEAPGLADVYGDEFEALYEKYEREGKARCSVPIQKVWLAIIKSQVETGTPYMLYKDQCNRKSNQKNLGTIKSSNLCVAPETWVRTSKGDRPIALLENQDVEVWNGHEWSPVTVRKTADSAELVDVRVRMSNEVTTIVRTISCTPEHKFILYDGSRVDAKDLQSGTELNPWVDQNGVQHTGTIVMVQYTGRKSSTYCFTELIRHQGMFNGIITGQCTEILEYTDPDTTAVCNLASIGLPTFVEHGVFNYQKLEEITRLVTRNLNKVIDYTYYPVDTAKRSNLRYRPIGIGVQGLADVYAMLKLNYGEGTVNRDIFETIYYAAVSESVKLAQLCGAYEGFEGSPASRGEFQFDMWGVRPTDRYDWESLRADMMKYGLRNSLLVAPMPTATTSQMFGFNECFEPFTSNIYLRRTLAGEFVVVNKYLVEDLKELGLWTPSLRTQIIRDGGSIAGIEEIPEKIRARYKTTWEISPRLVIDLAKERGPYICQSQSMNIFVEGPTNAKLSSIHMYAWKSGLKTGMYYLRTRPRTKAIQFTVDPSCVMCSS